MHPHTGHHDKGLRVPITKRTDYAVRILHELARLGPGVKSTARVISESAGVPPEYARAIVSSLVEANLIASQRGVGGGIELARNAEDITLMDVLSVMEQHVSLSFCSNTPDVCPRSDRCPVHRVWIDLDQEIAGYLANVTLADLVARGEELQRT